MDSKSAENDRILLGLLNSVESNGEQSQRHLAAELGIALGLVNAYLKRCVKKGLLKVSEAPARRYAYYLTPQGFAEKSRLTVEYLSNSFSFFRRAKEDCGRAFATAAARGCSHIVLVGKSDLAEIAVLCAPENGVEIVALVDAGAPAGQLAGVPVVASFDDVAAPFDAIVITDFSSPRVALEAARARLAASRIFAPALLGLNVPDERRAAS